MSEVRATIHEARMKRRAMNLSTVMPVKRLAASSAVILIVTSFVLAVAAVILGQRYQEHLISAGYLACLACAAVAVWALASFVETPAANRFSFPREAFSRRRLLTYGAVLSLLFCAGVCVLWALSQRQGYAVVFYNGAETDYAAASQGSWVAFGRERRPPHRRPQLMAGDIPLGSAVPRHPIAAVPHVALVLVSCVLPAAWAARHRRRTLALARQRDGLCPS